VEVPGLASNAAKRATCRESVLLQVIAAVVEEEAEGHELVSSVAKKGTCPASVQTLEV
jgi:hypothetical protein